MMKTFFKMIIPFTSILIIFPYGVGLSWEFRAQTGIQWDWWKDDVHRKGQQFHIPIRMEARYQGFSLRLLTAEIHTRLDLRGAPDRRLTHFHDTKINLSYELFEKLPVDILIGLDFNLPTGKTNLKMKDRGLLMDPELVSINKFGEGFNVNPNVSIAKAWGKFTAGIGVGYLWRGKYDQTTQFLEFNDEFNNRILKFYAKEYDPGEVFNANAEIRYEVMPGFQGRLFGQYIWYGKDRLEKEDYYQEGDLWGIGMGVQYRQSRWELELTLRALFRDKSRIKRDLGNVGVLPPGSEGYLYTRGLLQPIVTEPKNSHGDEWIGDLSIRYFLDEKTTLKSFLQGLYITKNDYPYASPRFIGRREKGSIGFGLSRILLPSLQGEIVGKAFLMHDEERFLPQFLSERNYRGYSVGLTLTGTF